MNKLEIKNWVEKNPRLVKMRESEAYPGLFVLKYTKRVFYDDLWNRFLEECRGTVIDKDFNVISRPFTKVYNYGVEKNAPKLKDDVEVDAYRKICEKYPNLTFMFECVHKNDPHIIPEKEGMYLIGYREKDWDSPVKIDPQLLTVLGIQLGCLPVAGFRTTVGNLLKLVKDVRHEGFVFYTDQGVGSKIKSPYYLTSKWVARNPRTDKLMSDQIKQQIDEEYYPLVDKIRENIVEYTAMDEQARLGWVREFLETT